MGKRIGQDKLKALVAERVKDIKSEQSPGPHPTADHARRRDCTPCRNGSSEYSGEIEH